MLESIFYVIFVVFLTPPNHEFFVVFFAIFLSDFLGGKWGGFWGQTQQAHHKQIC